MNDSLITSGDEDNTHGKLTEHNGAFSNVYLASCEDSEDAVGDKPCSCNESAVNDFECYFKHKINESKSFLDESKYWLNGTHSVNKHHKENIISPPIEKKENVEEQLFTKVSRQCFKEGEFCGNTLNLLNAGIELLDLDDETEVNLDKKQLAVVCFNSLPDEIKLRVFSYFTKRELCRFVAPVCLSWFHLAKDPMFWTAIKRDDFKDVRSELLVEVILSWCKNLIHLDLEDRSEITFETFEKLFRSCSKIEYISLKQCKQVDDDILQSISRHCKCIKGINLEGCSILNDKLFYNFIGLSLESVSVAHCLHISDEGGKFLVTNFQSLREIDFDGIQWITDDFVSELVTNHSSTLEAVLLDGENITDSAIKKLTTCPNLRILSLSFCHSLTHHSIDLVGTCTNLQVLKLRKGGMNFTNNSLLRYFERMSTVQGIKFKSLNLAECTEITDECLFYLSEKCPNLEYLDLSWCWEVSDDGLAFVIDSCHKLKELHLVGLHELYGIPFTRVVQNNPELIFLDLSQCNKIKDEIITKLVNAMPNLVAKDYYGDHLVNSANTKQI